MKYFLRSDDFISRLLFTRYAGNFKYPNDNGKRYIRLLTRQDLIKLTEIPPIRIWWQRLSLVLSTYFLLVVAFLSRNIEFDQSFEYIYVRYNDWLIFDKSFTNFNSCLLYIIFMIWNICLICANYKNRSCIKLIANRWPKAELKTLRILFIIININLFNSLSYKHKIYRRADI